jgi:hypothetical protein
MPIPRIFLAASVLMLTACATVAEREATNKQWSEGGVVVATNMCSQDRSVQHSKDPEGQRAYCGFEVPLGTHLPKCVCRDEKKSMGEREAVQQFMRDEAAARQNIRGN